MSAVGEMVARLRALSPREKALLSAASLDEKAAPGGEE